MKSINKRIGIIFLLLLLCISLLCFTSCEYSEEQQAEITRNRDLAEDFLDLVIAGEKSQAYAMASSACTYAEFEEFYAAIREDLEGVESFSLTTYRANAFSNGNGATLCDAVYEVRTDKDTFFTLTVSSSSTNPLGLDYVQLDDTTDFRRITQVALPFVNAFMTAISISCIVLAVFMIVDCVKRRVKLMPLWIIAILVSSSYSFSFGDGFNMGQSFGVLIQPSSLSVNSVFMSIAVTFVVPSGLIVYMLVRNYLPVKPPKKKPETADEPLVTATDAPAAPETTEALPSPVETAEGTSEPAEAAKESTDETKE